MSAKKMNEWNVDRFLVGVLPLQEGRCEIIGKAVAGQISSIP